MDGLYDVAIIGLGPAGATLARLLDRRFSVVAIDKKNEGAGFKKPCGGLLAPDAQKAVAGLGLTLPKDILVDPQIFAVRTIDLNSGIERNYQRFYINLDRHRFDLWLMSLIPESVSVIAPAVCMAVEKTGEYFSVRYKKDGREASVTAKWVVGADGANSLPRKILYPAIKTRRYAAVSQWFPAPDMEPRYLCVFDSKLTDCYSWGVSKDGYFILGGAFPLKGGRARFEALKHRLGERGFALESPVKTEGCVVLRPGVLDVRTGRDGILLIGEAAGFISPSSLEGISWAFGSARILAEVFNSRRDGLNRAYFYKTLGLRFNILVKSLKSLIIYWPFTRWLIMKSGLQKIEAMENDSERVNK